MKTIEDEIKGRYRNEYHKAIINLSFTTKQINYNFIKSLKKHGLTEPQYNILRVLKGYNSEGPSSIGFLKERMIDRGSDVSRLVDRLNDKNLLTRIECPEDRRQKAILITEKGLDLLKEMEYIDNESDSILSNLNDKEIIELNRILNKIRMSK